MELEQKVGIEEKEGGNSTCLLFVIKRIVSF